MPFDDIPASQWPATPPPAPAAPPLQDSAVLCRACGYDLTGCAIGGHCPECGAALDYSMLQADGRAISGFAIASMVLGIVSIPGCFCYGIPTLIMAPLAIAFYGMTMREIRQNKVALHSRGYALSGMICGWVSLGMLALGVVFLGVSILMG